LTNEPHFKSAIRDQGAGFTLDVIKRLRTHLAADGRDGAERATLVAAFTDSKIRPVTRRQSDLGVVAFPIPNALAIFAVHGQAHGVLTSGLSGLERVAADPIGRGGIAIGKRLTIHPTDRIQDAVTIKHPNHGVDA